MATYEYETSVNINGNYKEKPPRKEGYTTYVKGSVDVTKAGEYLITYTFIKQDPFDSITETRLVTVVDTFNLDDSPAPEIYLYGDTVVTISEGSSWTDPGAYAVDPEYSASFHSSFIDVKTVLPIEEDTWSSQPAGNYSILYYAVSKANRIGFATRTVVIEKSTVTISLNGCSEKYIEFPSGQTSITYVGPDYEGSGGDVIIDAGYDISGSSYTLAIGVDAGDGNIYPVQPNGIFFTAQDTDDTKTYEIVYALENSEGKNKYATRLITIVKPGDTSDDVVSAIEQQNNSTDGCLNRDPITNEEDLADEAVDDGDPDLTTEPLNPPTVQPDQKLHILCAGDTAFSGGRYISSWDSNIGKIPETIVEGRWVPISTGGDFAPLFYTQYGTYLPGETEKSKWYAKSSSIVWKLHTVHSETKITYSWGYTGSTALYRNPVNDFIFSTWEPYYDENGSRIGDIFYGFFGAHVFLSDPGWGNRLTKESVTFSEALGERWYIGQSPFSATKVTAELQQKHVDAILDTPIPGERVLRDPNPQPDGGNSTPVFRNFDIAVRNGGIGVADRDMISLRWADSAGARDVSDYCDYTLAQNRLPLFCSTTISPYVGYDGSNPYYFNNALHTPRGKVPAQLIEMTWTDSPFYGNPQAMSLHKHSKAYFHGDYFQINARWQIKIIRPDEIVYVNETTGALESITFDPDDSSKNYFAGDYASYSWNHWEAAFHWGSDSYQYKYFTNYGGASGDRIVDLSPDSSLHTPPSGQQYYRSLVAISWGSSLGEWADPQVSETKQVYTIHNVPISYTVEESVDPC